MIDSKLWCPLTEVSPHSPATLAPSQLRAKLTRNWDAQKSLTIHAMATSDGDWIPSPDDPSLTAEENKKNCLISRALKWPLHMSGYESLETAKAAKEAQRRVDVSREAFLAMCDLSKDIMDEYVLLEYRRGFLNPAMAALEVAVADLKQPDLIPSRSGSVASVTAPAPPVKVSVTKNTPATVMAQDQQQQSPCKPVASKLGPQSPEASSHRKATAISLKSQKPQEKLPLKGPSTKSPAMIPAANIKLLPPGTPSSVTAPVKTSPTKAAPAKPKQPAPVASASSSKAPATVSKSQNQQGKTAVKPPSAKSSPAKPKQPVPVASVSSSSKAPAAVSKSQTQQGKTPVKTPSTKSSPAKPKQPAPVASASSAVELPDDFSEAMKQRIGAVKAKYLLPVSAWPRDVSPQSQPDIASGKKLPSKRCLPSSSTSASSSRSESSSSSRSPQRSM